MADEERAVQLPALKNRGNPFNPPQGSWLGCREALLPSLVHLIEFPHLDGMMVLSLGVPVAEKGVMMKLRTVVGTMMAGMSIASSCFSMELCVLQVGGGPLSCTSRTSCELKASDGGDCKDLRSGKVYAQRGNKLIDPENDSVVMVLSESKNTIPVLRGRIQYEYVVTQPFMVAEEDDTDEQQDSGVSRRRSPAGNRAASPSPSPAGVTDVRTGEYYPRAAGGIINPRTGQFYPDVGAGYIDPRTGAFMPKH